MAYPALDAIPEVVGQYLDGRPLYDIELPVPGVQPQELILGAFDLDDLETEMAERQAAFDADQADRTPEGRTPVTWWPVGYYLDLDVGVIALYQLKMPGYTVPYVAPDEEA